MRHCVAAYAQRAAAGQCYLFHVDHAGQEATVEVSPFGRVAQSCGPDNCSNDATAWGLKVLGMWGDAFPPLDFASTRERTGRLEPRRRARFGAPEVDMPF